MKPGICCGKRVIIPEDVGRMELGGSARGLKMQNPMRKASGDRIVTRVKRKMPRDRQNNGKCGGLV